MMLDTSGDNMVEQPGARITTAMTVLAWTVLEGSWHDARDACRALAQLILEAVGERS